MTIHYLVCYRKKPFFAPNPAALTFKSPVTPTNACLSVILVGKDYGSKVSINAQVQRRRLLQPVVSLPISEPDILLHAWFLQTDISRSAGAKGILKFVSAIIWICGRNRSFVVDAS